MGRPPLSPDDVTVKTTLRLPRKLLARVESITGENRMSGWVRQAIEEKLAREEHEAAEDPAPRVAGLTEPPRAIGTVEDICDD